MKLENLFINFDKSDVRNLKKFFGKFLSSKKGATLKQNDLLMWLCVYDFYELIGGKIPKHKLEGFYLNKGWIKVEN